VADAAKRNVNGSAQRRRRSLPGVDADEAVNRTYIWFEHNSGWAPPDEDTLAEWLAQGVCRCPDECLVTPEGWCEHGLASWKLVLAVVEER
jgi:hypothetical protein